MHKHIITTKTIFSNEEIAEGVYLMSFQRDFEFKAGQVIGISTEENGPRRLYSISSGEKEEYVQVLYNVIEEGYLTPRLSDLVDGDNIWISEPRGDFLYDPKPSYWIASGTGIAPFYAMLKSGRYDQKTLLHGERYLERFYFYDAFSELLGDNYLRCCSQEEDPGTFHGRVTEYLQSVASLPLDHMYYLCGRAEMVVETRDILIKHNIPFNQIISEIYF